MHDADVAAEFRNSALCFVLFGGEGDLAQRKILPALFNLYLDGQLPERFQLLAVGRRPASHEELCERYRRAVALFSRRGPPQPSDWRRFCQAVDYLQADLQEPGGFKKLSKRLTAIAPPPHQQLFYLAVPPTLFTAVAEGLAQQGLNGKQTRIVVEKPIGHDLGSYLTINAGICGHFSESQVFRIDHYLGKETVQNILAFRFANPIFEPIWNSRYVDHVAITVAETTGVAGRGGYYDRIGALRDMVQNHLFQLLTLVAMEPPVAYNAEDIRNRKMDVMQTIRPIPLQKVERFAARGQYSQGWLEGEQVQGYRQETNVDPASTTETFAALKLYLDSWRWQGVPFYLRTGKRLAATVSEISIRFADVPHCFFAHCSGLNAQPARLVMQLKPEQGIILKFAVKEPGYGMRLVPADMRFNYQETFGALNEAYETLLRDVMLADATLFMRADQVEAAWRIVSPVISAWESSPAIDFPNYVPGTWGPEVAGWLIAQDGRAWRNPLPSA